MKKPKPEDFGISAKIINKIEAEEKKFDKIFEYIFWIIVFILALIWSSRINESEQITWGIFFITLFLMIPTAMILGAIGFPISKLLEKIIHFFKPDFRKLKNYKDKLTEYERWFVKTQLDFWRSLSGRQFEIELARLLQNHGHDVKVVGGAGDKGIDLILDGDTAVQCKAHKSKVGPASIRDLIGSMKNAKYKKGILASINGFTTGVYEYNKKNNIKLLDASNYIKLQKELN